VSETASARGYRQVATVPRERIEFGQYPARSRLPTEALLVDEFGVARDTVRRVIALLAEDALVVTSHGRGRHRRETSPRKSFADRSWLSLRVRGGHGG